MNSEVSSAEVLRLAETAGWAGKVRTAALCAVALDTPDPFTALFLPHGAGLRAVVALGSVAGAPAVCREAASVLLVNTCKVVRFVEAVFAEDNIWLEVAFDTPPSAEQLGDALAALSIACRLAGREVALLISQEDLAAEFLALRTQASPPFQTSNQED